MSSRPRASQSRHHGAAQSGFKLEAARTPNVPFNRPSAGRRELAYIKEAIDPAHLSGGGRFGGECQSLIRQYTECGEALLTNSATAALEMQGLLLDLAPGDEVIMPSYTFVTTASAIAQRQAVPVFVDIRRDTLNLDERLVESAITPRTRAIMAVHYGGVACEMDALDELAQGHGLALFEGCGSRIARHLPRAAAWLLGHIGGAQLSRDQKRALRRRGALLINDPELVERSKVLWEKGTNRSRFLRGEVDKYT